MPSPTQVLDVLKQARSLIAAGHCTETYARDRAGRRVQNWSDKAVSFCALGALLRASSTEVPIEDRWHTYDEAHLALDNVVAERYPELVLTDVNDKLGQQPTLDVYDEAIKRVTNGITY